MDRLMKDRIMEVKPRIGKRYFKCCICRETIIKDETEYVGKYDSIAYPIQMLCCKHKKLVNLIMDTFQHTRGKSDWTHTKDWRRWIEENVRILLRMDK